MGMGDHKKPEDLVLEDEAPILANVLYGLK
jgi:hypothetical protein